MSERFEPKLYEELKALVIQNAESAEHLKQVVLRANDVELTAEAFDKLLDRVEETKDALEEELGEGAFDPEEEEGEDPDEEGEEEEEEEEEEAAKEVS